MCHPGSGELGGEGESLHSFTPLHLNCGDIPSISGDPDLFVLFAMWKKLGNTVQILAQQPSAQGDAKGDWGSGRRGEWTATWEAGKGKLPVLLLVAK